MDHDQVTLSPPQPTGRARLLGHVSGPTGYYECLTCGSPDWRAGGH
ncbi:hypothetical protein BKA00_005440 [Actinomadura coerulea]|uniref:Uncharacterized protein n=1 Tax=Actinomadura coerulea TaxID=46159 RepID=A0A7X0G388_9ACTN|nr:hypothetical protein [Actinomadura coerulea]